MSRNCFEASCIYAPSDRRVTNVNISKKVSPTLPLFQAFSFTHTAISGFTAPATLFHRHDTASPAPNTWHTPLPPLPNARSSRPGGAYRECETLERIALMGPLQTKSIFWCQATDTQEFNDGIVVGEGGFVSGRAE